MAHQTPLASPPAPLTLDLTGFAESISAAFQEGTPLLIATASQHGQPDIALKGSFMVWDKDHLAFWERSMNETLSALRSNPHVCVMLRRSGPPTRFYGEAQVVEEAVLREAVWERVVPAEQSRDPEKKGLAVLIRVDRIRQGPSTVTR